MAEDRTVKRSFKDHDTLGREKFANFLIEVIKSGQSEEGSYTLAIDAPYGSGKTWFLQMLENKINEEYASTKQDVPLVAVRYDAWKYDYFDEPLEPLVEQIMQAEAMADEKDFQSEKQFWARLRSASASVFKSRHPHFAAFRQGWTSPKEERAEQQKQFAGYTDALEELQNALKEAASVFGHTAKLVVIIDELDRCRPDFAIRTLEVTKHLLASENVVFLYAVDMKQLGRAVESMYGAGMNAEGYLLRLFNHISILPKLNKSIYLRKALENVISEERLDMIVDEIHYQRNFLQLTYRDIDRIVSSYKILLKTLLQKYITDEAYLLYFYLLTLKYVKRKAFNFLLFSEHDDISKGYFNENPHVINESLRDALIALTAHSTIKFTSGLSSPLTIRVPEGIVKGRYVRYCFHSAATWSDTYAFGYCVTDDNLKNMDHRGHFLPDADVSGLIFWNDIENLFKAGDGAITIGEYLHQQLEMYNYESQE